MQYDVAVENKCFGQHAYARSRSPVYKNIHISEAVYFFLQESKGFTFPVYPRKITKPRINHTKFH